MVTFTYTVYITVVKNEVHNKIRVDVIVLPNPFYYLNLPIY